MSISVMNKNRIRRRFDRSQDGYDGAAEIQSAMAGKLLYDLQQLPQCRFHRVLEIGCGTGLFTDLMTRQFQISQYFANDLVPGILDPGKFSGRTELTFLGGDIETLSGIPDNLDIVVSNAAFQWLNDLPRLLETLSQNIRPGGWLAFSTFGPDNLLELAEVSGLSLQYHDKASIGRMASGRFDLLAATEEKTPCLFPDALAVIRHLRTTGVNSLSDRFWSKKRLDDLLTRYQASYGDSQGVRLTYHPMNFIFQRKTWPAV